MSGLTNKEIGKRITEARDAAKINKKELADCIHVAASTITRYEDGTIKKIKIHVISAIANALNVNPMWIIGKSDLRLLAKENKQAVSEHNVNINLCKDEMNLILKYRSLDDRGKFNVQETVEREYSFISKQDGLKEAK